MLNVPSSDARNQTVILLCSDSSRAQGVLHRALLADHGFTPIACLQPVALAQAIEQGCRIGLVVLEHEQDVAWLEPFVPAMQASGIAWIGLIAPQLVALAAVRECIGEMLFNFLTLPVQSEHLLLTLRHAWGMAYLRHLHESTLAAAGNEGVRHGHRQGKADSTVDAERSMVGKTAQMQKLFAQIRKVAGTDASVLITGAFGTGKELAALSVHRQSRRREGPFIAVNCGAIAPQLFQSELFGHEKGAFTGAVQRKIGRIEAAQGGTLFLDEIGDMPFEMQVNLLRFLQEKTIERVGASQAIPIDVRVIAATHVDLADAVAQRRFREDLYYRINVVCIMMPRLADRGEDIEDIALHYFAKFARAHNRSLRGFSKAAMEALLAYSWPGNVRELVNRVQRAAVMAEGRFIQPEDLGFERDGQHDGMMTLQAARAAAEQLMIRRALSQARNQVARAAVLLGVSRVTLYRLIEKYKIHTSAPASLSSPQLAANDMPAARLVTQPL